LKRTHRQYAAFYNTSGTYAQNLVTLGRRKINPVAAWEFMVFKDYVQTTIDGHNTISLGISTGDGTIHLSYGILLSLSPSSQFFRY
jgi:hypothetical protein